MIYTSMCTTNKGLMQLDFMSRKPIYLDDEVLVESVPEYEPLILGLQIAFDVKIYSIQVTKVDVNLNRLPNISW